jgi:hypothetical protein
MLMISTAIWLKWWSDANAGRPTQRVGMYLGVYSALEVTAVIFFGLMVWYGSNMPHIFSLLIELFRHCFTTMIIKSGLKLHQVTLTTVTSSVNPAVVHYEVHSNGRTGHRWLYSLWLIQVF